MSGDSDSSSCSSLRMVPSISAAKESWEKPGNTQRVSNSSCSVSRGEYECVAPAGVAREEIAARCSYKNEGQASRAPAGLRHTLRTPGQEAMRLTLNPAGDMDGSFWLLPQSCPG